MRQASQGEAIAHEMPASDRRGEFANGIRPFLKQPIERRRGFSRGEERKPPKSSSG